MYYRFEALPVWPREDTADRQPGHQFKTDYNSSKRKLFYECERVAKSGEGTIVIGLMYRGRDILKDGTGPRGDVREPDHPGVMVSFESKHGPLKFYCDAFTSWRKNVHAIALTLERLRLADLYGVTKRGEQYTGWRALPAPMQMHSMTAETASQFVAESAGRPLAKPDVLADASVYRNLYHVAAKRLHHDAGGDRAPWDKLQEAHAILDAHHQVKGGRS